MKANHLERIRVRGAMTVPVDVGSHGSQEKKSLDAVVTSALLLFVVSAALAFAGRLSPQQRMQLTAGSAGGAVGLLIGYSIGRLRP